MSLATDSIFVAALQSNADLLEKLTEYIDDDGTVQYDETPRLYGTAIGLPDEDADNVPVPYVIVTFEGLTNDQGTKDDRYESDYDTVNIGVTVVGRTLNGLHDLTQMVRDTILSYLSTTETAIMDYQFAAQQIQYDSLKPCYWQVLTYQCDTVNTNDDEQESNSDI